MASWEASSYCGALTGSWKSAYTWRWVERAMFPEHRKGKPQKSPFHCIFGSFQMKLWDPPSQPWGQGPRFSFCFLDKKMIWNGMKERPSPSPSMWRIFVLVCEKPGSKSSSFLSVWWKSHFLAKPSRHCSAQHYQLCRRCQLLGTQQGNRSEYGARNGVGKRPDSQQTGRESRHWGRWDRLGVLIGSTCRFSFLKQLSFQSTRIK